MLTVNIHLQPQAHTYIKVSTKQFKMQMVVKMTSSCRYKWSAVILSHEHTPTPRYAPKNLNCKRSGDRVALIAGQELATKNFEADLGTYLILYRKNDKVILCNLDCPVVDNRDSRLTESSSESELYERPPNRRGKGQGVRVAVLQEKETLRKNGQRTSQQGMSAKPSSNTKPASLEIDEYEGNEMQVDGEGTRGNEEREAMERTETKKRCNEASKAVESSTKRKTHKKGNNLSLERYVTCDVAFAGFVSHRHGSVEYNQSVGSYLVDYIIP